MNTIVFVRRFLADYARNPVNLLMLVLVPAVFVVAAAGYLVDAAKLLSDAGGDAPSVATATAGWAAAFLAGIAMYFQVSAARDADRGLVVAGLPAGRLVAARLAAGLALALLASVVALVALQLRTGIDQPARVIAGTAMFAVIYLGIGATVGALVRNPVNGTVLILFVWILDIFFGPSMGVGTKPWTRALPTHFVTLWMVQRPSGHGGRLGDLGIAGAWTLGAFALAFTVVVAAARISHRRHWWRARPPGRPATNWPPQPGWDGGTGAATRCCGCCWRPYRRCSSCSPRPPPRTGRSRSPQPRTACAPRTWWTCSTCTPA